MKRVLPAALATALAAALALLAALACGGCVDDITAPACNTYRDCDADAGYLFCQEGYCFKEPIPEGLGDDAGGVGQGDASLEDSAE